MARLQDMPEVERRHLMSKACAPLPGEPFVHGRPLAERRVAIITTAGLHRRDQPAFLIGDTGGLQQAMGGYRIKIYHSGAFPWAEVFKALVFRDFRVYVTRHKADLFIEAQP